MRKFFIYFILIVLIAGSVYTWFFYFNVYDDANREGKLYYFSKAKGNIVKTAEGIMIQPGLRSARTGGLNTNEFHFSVTDKAIADSLEKSIGKIVVVHYVQYRKTLFWRGENNDKDNKEKGQFIVDRIISVSEDPNGEEYIGY